jgi:hypothetical protein
VKKRTLDAFFAPPAKKKRMIISNSLSGDDTLVYVEAGGEDEGSDQGSK